MGVLFTVLLNAISAGNSAKILHSDDTYDLNDVAFIDGACTEYLKNTVYFVYLEQVEREQYPPQCILAYRGEIPTLPRVNHAVAIVEDRELFQLFNAAKALLDASRGQGFYGALMDCAARCGAVEPMMNLAATKLGHAVGLLDADFKILA